MKVISLIKRIQPEFFFIFASVFFGLLFILLTPPFQIPDEITHFHRAYQISNGQIIASRQDQRVGGYIPSSMVKCTYPFLSLRWDSDKKTNFNTIQQALKIPMNDSLVFADFPNTALYPPVTYFPQSMGMAVLKLFNLPPLYLYYGAKISALLFWSVCIFYIIKLLPWWKWEFTLLALLPMSVFINASLSADLMCNVSAFAFIAYILRTNHADYKITFKDKLILPAFALLIAASKFTYSPLLLLVFCIPYKKFATIKQYATVIISTGVCALVTLLIWSSLSGHLYINYADYNKKVRGGVSVLKGADVPQQISHILHHPVQFSKVLLESAITGFNEYSRGYIGTLGWLDTYLPTSIIITAYLFIFLIFASSETPSFLQKPQRLIILSVALLTMVTLFISQYLIWGAVGADKIDNIQGRYWIPFCPLFFISISGIINKFRIRYLSILVSCFTLLLLASTAFVISNRYYDRQNYVTESYSCNAEEINNDKFITSNPNVFLEINNARDNKAARSGSYSVLSSPQHMYTFVFRTNDINPGDVFEAEVWKKGNGFIVIDIPGQLYKASCIGGIREENTDWVKIDARIKVPDNLQKKEMVIYAYSPEDSAWFDDIKITHKQEVR